MAHIRITEGLDIPIDGKPSGELQTLPKPKMVALNLDPFIGVKFKLLARVGDRVKIGQPITEDKTHRGRFFVSPGSGVVREVRRGLKRRLLDVVIELDDVPEYEEHGALDPSTASRADILALLKKGGALAHIHQRPFDILANPEIFPRSIFVRALESAPFAPPAEMQVEGYERQFQAGLTALSKLCDGGKLHLVYRTGTSTTAFSDATDCVRHTVEGPHPSSLSSVHIHHLDPIQGIDDSIWTLSTQDVIVVGELLLSGHYHTERVVSIAGPGIEASKRGFFRASAGHPIEAFIAGRNEKGLLRMISGDPLSGVKVESEDFLGFYHSAFTVIPESLDREMLHFFRLGTHKFTASRAYLSGFVDNSEKTYDFTTSNRGEERPFVDGTVYQAVSPMQIPIMHLVKALMAEDYELAEVLGGLEVAAEDFALSTFVCPCKIEMQDIVRNGLRAYAAEVLT